MAIGNPLLAVYNQDGNVRVYELAGGVFVSSGSLGGFLHKPPVTTLPVPMTPTIKWVQDGKYVGIVWWPDKAKSGGKQTAAIDRYGVKTGFYQAANNPITVWTGFDDFTNDQAYHYSAVSVAANNRNQIDASGAVLARFFYLTSNTVFGGPNMRCMKVSPDAKFVFVGCIKPSQSYFHITADGNFYGEKTTFPSLNSADVAAWSADSKYLATGSHVDKTVEVWRVNVAGTGFEKIQELTIEADNCIGIEFSGNGRYLAAAYKPTSGSTYTVIYKRVGPFYRKIQTITGMGDLLSIDYIGKYVIDSYNKKAYLNSNDVFSEMVGAMDAIVAGGYAQDLSPHVTNAVGTTYLYDNALKDFVLGNVNLANLKVEFLTSAASFDPTHASLSQVTNAGAYRPTGGGWPAGGLPLTGIAGVGGTRDYKFTVNDVTRIIIQTELHCRYAVIYDNLDSNKKPLIFIDLGEQKDVLPYLQIKLSWKDGTLISLTS